MAPASFMPSGRNEVIVRVYSYEERCPKGTLSGPRFSVPVAFSSLTQLLMVIEGVMDRSNSPQRSEDPRTFRHTGPQIQPAGHNGDKPLATFRVNVMFRQNASWQGALVWADQAMDAQFRSALELIRLMDSALTAGLERADEEG